MDRKGLLSNIATGLLVVCTTLLTTVVVRREFFSSANASQLGNAIELSDADWKSLSGEGTRFGPADAKVTVVVFSDFQCPWCGRFARDVVMPFRKKYPQDVAFVYRHLPLTQIHRMAYPSARAAECAGAQGKFEPFHDALFTAVDTLNAGLLLKLAEKIGVPDQKGFSLCATDTLPVPSIERDVRIAKAIGARGTPTVIVNGWRLAMNVDAARMDSIVTATRERR